MKKTLIQEAVRIAKQALPTHPWFIHRKCHFSFIVQNNKILEWGMNRQGNPPKAYPNFAAIHSEIDAFRKAKGIMNHNIGFEIINIRLNRQGQLRLSAPCERCGPFIKAIGCTHVHFSTNMNTFAKQRI